MRIVKNWGDHCGARIEGELPPISYMHAGDHCVHPAPSPGTFACCRCRLCTTQIPGDRLCSVSALSTVSCERKRFVWLRHRIALHWSM